MSIENPDPGQRQSRRAWPTELAYQSWRMWLVAPVLAVLILAGAFLAGRAYQKIDQQYGRTGAEASAAASNGDDILYWTCSMHPQIKLPKQTPCPICFMDLVPVRTGDDQDADAPRMKLSRRARELARVQTSPVKQQFVTHELNLVGRVMPDETGIRQISSYVPGRLDRLFVDYTGILVRRGDHLAEIYSPELLVAQQEFLTALENVDRAGRSGTQSPLITGTGNAMLEAARRKLELWGIPDDEIQALARTRQPRERVRIDAPLEGWVLERQGFQGMYVETGTRIFTLADLRTVWILLDAYELDVGFIRPGQKVEFEVEALPGQVFTSQVSYIDPVLDPATRTVRVRLVVPNLDLRLKPDMFVRARLQATLGEGGSVADTGLVGKWICPMHPEVIGDEPGQCSKCGMDLEPAESLGYAATDEPVGPALAVPQSSVLLTGRRAVVYLEFERDGEPVYEGRTVRLGPRAGDLYIVTAGLQPGDRVVTRGAMMIDSALQIQGKPSMMQPPDLVEDEPQIASRYIAGAMYHQHMEPVIEAYLSLSTALANDDPQAAIRAAADLEKAIARAEAHGLEAEDGRLFGEQVKAISESVPGSDERGIEQLRNHLPELTGALEMYLRTFGHERSEPLVKAYCPMAFDDKGASWLQEGEQISNPYFGAKMLRCGEVKDILASSAEADEKYESHYVAGAMYHAHARPVVTSYLRLTDALAKDHEVEARTAIDQLRNGLKQAAPHGLEDGAAELFVVRMAAIQASLPGQEQPTVDQMRDALVGLTRSVKAYLRTFGHDLEISPVEAYCPMAFDDTGAAWLQAKPGILNPYFGAKMLRCGEIRGSIQTDGQWDEAP